MAALEKKIADLSKTRTHDELVRELQVILRQLAYYASQSETAVNDYREQWHDDYTNSLYEDAGLPPTGPEGGRKKTTFHSASAAAAGDSEISEMHRIREEARRKERQQAHQKQVKRTAKRRPREADVPASLRRLLEAPEDSSSDSD